MRILLLAAVVLILGACSSYAPRYTTFADTQLALARAGIKTVRLEAFQPVPSFQARCRLYGPVVPPEGMNVTDYVRGALVRELSLAGMLDGGPTGATLTGSLERVAFSARGTVHGTWAMQLRLRSSNGRELLTTDEFVFRTGFFGSGACERTADALLPAVQQLLFKAISSGEFRELLDPQVASAASQGAPARPMRTSVR